MPGQQQDDIIGKARESSNWFVGLSGAAVGGGLAKLELVEKFPPLARFFFLVATGAFLWSIVTGIFYYFQLLALSQAKEKVTREEVRTPQVQTDLDAAIKARTDANKKLSRFHTGTFLGFSAACACTVLCLGCVLFWPPKELPKPLPPAAPPSNHFALVTVPVHVSGRLLHDHTILLDQQTGTMWLMECRTNKSVEFKRVLRLKLDGTPEADASEPAPPAATKP